MPPHAKTLTALAVLCLLALGACSATATPSRGAVAAASPSTVEPPAVSPSPLSVPSAADSPSAFECDDDTTGCIGTLNAGVHSSSNFTIPLQITVPDGWVNVRDITRTYEIEPSSSRGVPGHPDIEVLALNAIPDQASCGPNPLAGAGSGPQDFIDFVTGHPGLEATAPVPVTIDGYGGHAIDFRVRADRAAMCPDIDPVHPVVVMLTSTNTDPPFRHLAYSRDDRVRWIILDVAGETVIVESRAPAGQFDAAMTEQQPIIDSLDFTPGG